MFKRLRVPWYEAIYVAIAIATFKHSAWAYSVTLEGPVPVVEWNNAQPTLPFFWSVGVLAIWYIFGGLMAAAVDVSMLFASREIRRGNRVYVFAFISAAFFSGITQLLYVCVHAAALDFSEAINVIAPLQEGGWMWTALQYCRLIGLPLSLPLTATIYTAALLVQRRREEAEVEEAKYTARQASLATGKNYQYILQLCNKGVVGTKDEQGRWQLSEHDLILLGGKSKQDDED